MTIITIPRKLINITGLLVVIAAAIQAQPRQLSPILAVDNVSLFDRLLTDQQFFEEVLVNDSTKSAVAKDLVREKYAKSVGLSGTLDYSILHQAASKMLADASISSNRTPAKLRQEASERAVQQLRRALSPDSYNRLRAYLHSTQVNNIRGAR